MQIKEDYANIIWKRARDSAKKRGITFELSRLDVMNMTVPITCPALGIPIKMENGQASDNSLSIDRINSEKGYSFDNCIFVSWRANKLKSDASLNELVRIAEYYSTIEKESLLLENTE